MSKKQRDRLAQGRVRTFDYMPYMAKLVYSMKQRPTPGIQTVAISQDGILYWDPEFIEGLTEEQLAYTILHETLHLLFRHAARAQEVYGDEPSETQQLVMNIAGDLVIEQTMAGMRQQRPPGAIHLGAVVPALGNLTLDLPPNLDMLAYYREIMKLLPPQRRGRSGDDSGEGDGDQSGGGGGNSDKPRRRRKQKQDGKPGAQPGKGGVAADHPPNGGGSSGDGKRRPWEEPDDTWAGHGEINAANQVEQSIRQHLAKHPGSVPGSLVEQLKGILRPQPDPWDALRSAVVSSVASPIGGRMSTYRRLSKKQPADCSRLRGWISTSARAVVIVDTSGSMGDRETKEKALGVIAQGLKRLRSVKVVCADTRIRSRMDVKDIQNFRWVGGGGTDMAAVLQDVDKTDKPDSIVLITDGYTGWPARQTNARVVVALTEDSSYAGGVPAWCKKVPLFQRTQ